MVFSSIIFLFYFLPFTLVFYFLVPGRYKNWVLLAASIGFYAWGGASFLLILVGSTIFDFYLVKALHKSNSNIKRKLLLALSLTLTIGILAYFKYANFFIENVNQVLQFFHLKSFHWVHILLPIGISFFSFQKLTYSADVYYKNMKHFMTQNSGFITTEYLSRNHILLNN